MSEKNLDNLGKARVGLTLGFARVKLDGWDGDEEGEGEGEKPAEGMPTAGL